MTIPILPAYDAPYKPVPQVTPLTYRDNDTLLKKIDWLKKYINRTLVPFVNDNFKQLGDDFEEQVNLLIQAVNAAIQLVIDDSIEAQDPVVAALIQDLDSATSNALDDRYTLKTDFAMLTAAVDAIEAIIDTGRLSEAELDDTYAAKDAFESIAAIINTGRLSEEALNENYVRYAPKPTGNRVTDQANLQALITEMTGVGGTIVLHAGTYRITSLANVRNNKIPNIVGAGIGVTILESDGSGPAALTIEGNSGYHNGVELKGFTIKSAIGSGVGLRFWAICGAKARDMQFDSLDVGILFHNNALNDFTEFCTAEDSFFESACKTAIEYRKDNGGAESFHGSGLVGRCVINQAANATAYSVKINAGCLAYNAPLETTFFLRNSAQPAIGTYSARPAMFIGNIRVEQFANNCTLGWADTANGARAVNIAGPITALGGTGFKRGNIALIEQAYWNDAGYATKSVATSSKSITTTASGASPGITLLDISNPADNVGAPFLVSVYISGNNYDNEQILAVFPSQYNPGGIVVKIADGFSNNAAAYGPPVYSFSDYKLTVVNSNYPAGINIRVSNVNFPRPNGL